MELITGNVMDHTVRVMDASLTAPVWSVTVEGTQPPRTECGGRWSADRYCATERRIQNEGNETGGHTQAHPHTPHTHTHTPQTHTPHTHTPHTHTTHTHHTHTHHTTHTTHTTHTHHTHTHTTHTHTPTHTHSTAHEQSSHTQI